MTPIASRIAAVIAGEDHELIGPLMESLETDLLPRDDRAAQLLGVKLHSLERRDRARARRVGAVRAPERRADPAVPTGLQTGYCACLR